MTGSAPRGLSAAELAAACDELRGLVGATVADVVAPGDVGQDQLLLVLAPGLLARKEMLHVVPGGPHARICTTARRWPKDAMRRAWFAEPLVGSRLVDVQQLAGERIAVLRFRAGDGERRLIAELFGSRGLLVLADGDGRVVRTSRPVLTATRRLAETGAYVPPARSGADADRAPPLPSRFAPPVLAAIDDHFTRREVLADARQRCERAMVSARRAAVKARAKVDGIGKQLADVGRAASLRNEADLMLAYQHSVPRGATSMQVPDPNRDGETLLLELDPARPVVVQAQALYEKARRLDDSRAVNECRLLQAQREADAAASNLAALEPVAASLAALEADAPELLQRVGELQQALPREAAPVERAREDLLRTKAREPRDTDGENVRRFVSAEGYPILVGRNNEQNDRLTMRIANGNDLWLHVGGGRAGSHVVVRLPKQKTASLETLLDAGTLAVHFSKARGEPRIDVIYTHRKHVRKPKGLPAGAVVPSQTKTITVLRDEARLQRLLGSTPESE